MDNRFLNQIYKLCPSFLQNVFLTGYSLLLDRERYGGKFNEIRDLLSKTQWYSESDLIGYQEDKLK